MKKVDIFTIKDMYRSYIGGMTLIEVAKKFGLKSGTTVLYHFQNRTMPTRKRGGNIKESQKGPNNGNWKGGKIIGKKGYVRLWNPSHQRSDTLGYVYEHIMVAEKLLGHRLGSDYIVHHINGIKNDNRPENLHICTQSDHAKIHLKEKRHGINTAK